MKKSAVLLGVMVGLFLVISGWGIIPHVHAAPIEIRIGHGDSPDIYTSRKAASSTVFKVLVETFSPSISLSQGRKITNEN